MRKRSGSQSSSRVQPSRRLNRRLASTIRAAVRSQLGAVDVPAGHRPQQRRPLGEGVGEDAAQELAQDQRVDDRRAVLGHDRGGRVRRAAGQAVVAPGEIGLIRARAVVVRPAGVDRQPERHRLQRARLVAGELQPLHVRRRSDSASPPTCAAARREPSASRSPEPVARADLVQRAQQRRRRRRSAATARRSARARRTPSPRRSCRPAEIVSRPSASQRALAASTASGSDDAAQGPEREDVLVLDPHLPAALGGVDVLAADRARRARVARHARGLRRGPRRRAAAPRRTWPPGSCGSAASRSR